MNKFKIALENLRSLERQSNYERNRNTAPQVNCNELEELVNRATPQIPIKEETIIFATTGYDENDMPKGGVMNEKFYKCPICHKKLFSIGSQSYKERSYKFCSKCGQAIDWSDEDE